MIKGTLFTQHFLINGIKDYDSWKNISESELTVFKQNIKKIFTSFPVKSKTNESTTERDLVDPTLKLLGWDHFLTQQTTEKKGRANVPDYLLFISEENKKSAQAEKEQWLRYKHGAAIVEAKAWDIPLDRKANEALEGVPSNQILRYLTSVDVQSDGNIQWGILTNGRIWRLYFNRAKSKSEEFFEIDLAQSLELPGFQTTVSFLPGDDEQDWLKIFFLFFQKDSFKREKGDKTFHEFALTQGKFWESKVADDLSDVVFTEVFPTLLKKLKENDPNAPKHPDEIYLKELRENTLTLLYRLLFILYAEDRNLLPVFDPRYDDYGLRKKIREDVAKRMDENHAFSTTRDNYYHHVRSLCEAIDKGDESVGLPPYNGGLFDAQKSQLLTRTKLPDNIFAEVIDKLSRRVENNTKKWINYYDLSVQQLGSIYERLLEFHPSLNVDGDIIINPNIFARKTSGSYYTPETLVKLILERTIGPLIEEKKKDFEAKIDELKSSKIKKGEKNKALKHTDPASEILNLKICDPAMGSGHFLVSLVDYLADHVLEAIDESESEVPWADQSEPYTSPVSERIISIRTRILKEAKAHNWAIKEEQLDDKHIIRRMILKRCVYGVDKNPMAVELAKVALWLHTFTVGAPLSFLDHHLRYGDSLFGEWISNVLNELSKKGTLISNDKIQGAKQAVSGMQKVEDMTDADIAEVKTSASTFNQVVEAATKPLNSFLSIYHALKWVSDNSKEDKTTINEYLVLGGFGDIVKVADGSLPIDEKNKRAVDFKKLFSKAKELIEEERFLNWELAFPGVWDKWESPVPTGGFDAVVGNPPWDRIKLQQVEWFSARKPEIAKATKASDREKMIKALEKKKDPLWNDYEKASWHAQTALLRARSDDQYPLLSTGDINLYSLFVERAHRLIKPKGMVGLLIPSGIAADKSASEFFKSISTAGRLAALYDFENKKVFFPDVHSSFKFCAYIAGGSKKKFERTELAFFLHNTSEIKKESYTLSNEDFLSVNPNTGTAPIFRTKKDADIVLNIYKNFPALNNHSKGKTWPVKYSRMFDMTNDSNLFRTKEDLEKEGFYPVEGNRFNKGDEAFVPLYVGKMIWYFDHRASSVTVNEENLKVAASSKNTSSEEHKNPNYFPESQYLISEKEVLQKISVKWAIAFRDITNGTNERTFISTIVPSYGCNNKLPLLLPESDIPSYAKYAPLLVANLSSILFDFVARCKIQGTSMNWYIAEQLPIISPDGFTHSLGKTTIESFIKEQVLHLTYTASDLKPFALDMGYKGEPFIWNEEDRRHRKAKLDALFFNLYGISEEDADYILNTFPITKKDDEQEFGRYLTRDLILAYMRALKAGDTETNVKLK